MHPTMLKIMVKIMFTILRSAQIHRLICCPCLFKGISQIVINFLMFLFLSDALFIRTNQMISKLLNTHVQTDRDLNKYANMPINVK